MPEEPTVNAPPAFVVQVRTAIEAAVARHGDQLAVHHEHLLERGVDGWRSTLRLTDHPEVDAAFWYDSADRDVMFSGDAPYREWSVMADVDDAMPDEQAVQVCLREVRGVIDDLVGAGRTCAVTRAARRRRLGARSLWQRLVVPRTDR